MQIVKNLRLSSVPKNLLIFLPIIISGNLNNLNFEKAFVSLIFFSLITSICYLINDFTDKKIDKNNLTKNNPNLTINEFIRYIICLLIILIFFILKFNSIINYVLYIYLFNFLIYNFYAKKKKYLDIIFLTCFYILRILYGTQLFDYSLSLGFLIYCITLFGGLSIAKRLTQVKINNLTSSNKLIAYSYKDVVFLKMLFNLVFLINIMITILYLFYNIGPLNLHQNFFIYQNVYSDIKILLLFIIYLSLTSYVFYVISTNKINKDIYQYFVTDRTVLLIVFVGLIVILQ